MKPLLLKMISFGPFINETIDFSLVDGKGIFLITGDTGSGKTTIFDGISVALFGESSGDERTALSFKSDYEDATEMMRVEFTFEINQKKYRVERVPRQSRKKLRGEGTTEYLGDATLLEIKDDQEIPIEYDRNVTEKIQEILGVEAKQFRQLVMIPQGQFRKLITENSGEREKVLKKLFDVYQYQRFQNLLEQRSSLMTTDLEKIRNQIRIEIEHLSLSETINLEETNIQSVFSVRDIIQEGKKQVDQDIQGLKFTEVALIQLKETIFQLEDRIELGKKNNLLLKNYQEAKDLEDGLLAKSDEMRTFKVRLKQGEATRRIIPIEQNFLQRKGELQKQEKLISQLKGEKIELERAQQYAIEAYQLFEGGDEFISIEQKKQEHVRLNLLYPKVQDYHKTILGLKHTQEQANRQQLDLNLNIQRSENGKITLFNLEKEKDSLEGCELKKQQCDHQLDSDRRKYKLYDSIRKSLMGIKEFEKELTSERIKLIEQLEMKEKQKGTLSTLREQFIEGQSAFLAANLIPGEACPVCGSKEHPNINKHHGLVPTKDELNKANENLEIAEQKGNLVQNQVHRLEQAIENENDTLKRILQELEETFGQEYKLNTLNLLEECEFLKSQLVEKNQEVKQMLNLYENQMKCQKNVKMLIEQSKQEISMQEVAIQTGQAKLQESMDELIKKQTTKDSIEEEIGLDFIDEKCFSQQMNQTREDIIRIESKYQSLKKVMEEKIQDFSRVEIRIIENAKMIEEQHKAVKTANDMFLESLIQNHFPDAVHYQNAILTDHEFQSYTQLLEEYEMSKNYNEKNLRDLSMLIQGLQPVEMDGLLLEMADLKEKLEVQQKKHTLLELQIKDNQKQIQKIEQYSETLFLKMEEWSKVNELNLLANGKGKIKVTFERYILATFLEDILKAANLRLYPMSNGRYEMNRKGQSTDRRLKTGLDLEVFDYYTGKARDINTLSGGESFKAALSLALGLSDVACSHAGGIRLDTMFIDEGFGSLSAEALDGAIDCLMELNEVGRLVGIISHVRELKERIDTQLIVEKSNAGSTTHFVI